MRYRCERCGHDFGEFSHSYEVPIRCPSCNAYMRNREVVEEEVSTRWIHGLSFILGLAAFFIVAACAKWADAGIIGGIVIGFVAYFLCLIGVHALRAKLVEGQKTIEELNRSPGFQLSLQGPLDMLRTLFTKLVRLPILLLCGALFGIPAGGIAFLIVWLLLLLFAPEHAVTIGLWAGVGTGVVVISLMVVMFWGEGDQFVRDFFEHMRR